MLRLYLESDHVGLVYFVFRRDSPIDLPVLFNSRYDIFESYHIVNLVRLWWSTDELQFFDVLLTQNYVGSFQFLSEFLNTDEFIIALLLLQLLKQQLLIILLFLDFCQLHLQILILSFLRSKWSCIVYFWSWLNRPQIPGRHI